MDNPRYTPLQLDEKDMSSSIENITYYTKDFETCKSQDRMKSFYDHCHEQFESLPTPVHISDIRDYGASLLKEFLYKENSLILDIGVDLENTCASLRRVGFFNIHGLQSGGNKTIVEDNSNYKELFRLFSDHEDKLPFSDNSYDGIISVGYLSSTQKNIETFVDELCRVVKPGGYAMFTFDDVSSDVRRLMTSLGEKMFTQSVELTLMEKQHFLTRDRTETSCTCCLIKVLS